MLTDDYFKEKAKKLITMMAKDIKHFNLNLNMLLT